MKIIKEGWRERVECFPFLFFFVVVVGRDSRSVGKVHIYSYKETRHVTPKKACHERYFILIPLAVETGCINISMAGG